MLPVSHANFSLGFKVKRFAQGLGWNPALRHQAWMGSIKPAELERLFSERYADRALARNPYAIVSSFHQRGSPRDALDALVALPARLA